ncbi:MAG: right-handed parallel beta-helix repeat-containing protein, partial [Verrucomicrobia bacterium]|nr:right-handed parallel beta-helix repeat-containing protein [Verrucomicrobiota bacterium]
EGDVRPRSRVTGVTFSGLTFSDADYEAPADGLISPQSAVPMRGGFRATHAVDCRVEECAVANVAGYGVDLGRGTQRWRVVGNTVRDSGAGGVRLGEPGDRQPDAFDACHSHQVTDNEIVRLGRLFAPGCGVILFQAGTNRIAHNHIADLYYTGISVGWNWGYEVTPCRNNLIEFNRVEQVGQGRLSDMGGFYTLGPQSGTVIRNNLFRDVQSYRYGGWAMYTDEGSTGIVVENNVAYRCRDAGFHQHYGRDNVIRNNLIAWNENHSVMRTRVEDHRSFRFTHNVVITRSGTLLGSNWGGTTNQFWSDGNVWFDTRLGTHPERYSFAGESWSAWRARGQDVHSVIADPLLVDPERPELGLRTDSPAFALGYRQIDLSTVGPRARDRRE